MAGGYSWRSLFVRFLLSGAFNTVATWLLYLLLIQFVSYRVGYSIAFLSGIGLAYVLSRYFVFRRDGGAAAVAVFPLIYLLQYLLGLGIVSLWVDVLGWQEALAPLAAVALTVPITFLLTRRVFSGGA